MRRKGTHQPTIEDVVEISGIETLHPGGLLLTRRTAELAGLAPSRKVLDVSSGRGTQAIYYAKEWGVEVVGLDLAEAMVLSATERAQSEGVGQRVSFVQGDSQDLPFPDSIFDVVVNECAVGIPANSQRVLDEMVRVTKPGGVILIHESIWNSKLSVTEKDELSERYGTTPLEHEEWLAMLTKAGVKEITFESERWSKPENFWQIRKDRDVSHYSKVLTLRERAATAARIAGKYGIRGLLKAFENERLFYKAVIDGKLGYGIYRGIKENGSVKMRMQT